MHWVIRRGNHLGPSNSFFFHKFNMAGAVRQPFDEAAFERYLLEHVPEIQAPIRLKQV